MRLEEKFGANFVTDLLPCFFPRLEPASHLKRFENDSDWLILLPVFNSCNWSESSQRVLITVKARYNEVPGITIDLFRENSASARRVCASPLQLQQIIWERIWI